MEIKSGKNAQLTNSERKIRQLIEEGMVRWELLQKTDRKTPQARPNSRSSCAALRCIRVVDRGGRCGD